MSAEKKSDMKRCMAVIVAAGKGTRMGGPVPKQFLDLAGKPVLYYTIAAFEQSPLIDGIVLVAGADQVSRCREEIVKKYGFGKVRKVIPGGAERCDSVLRGILACEDAEYVMIQDGVRPFVTEEILERGFACAVRRGTAVAGVRSKDTVKIVDGSGMVQNTPERKYVWNVQTPQIFKRELLLEAYDRLPDRSGITDDAMVVEKAGISPVYMFEGGYWNIKITTPEDLPLAESILQSMENDRKERED